MATRELVRWTAIGWVIAWPGLAWAQAPDAAAESEAARPDGAEAPDAETSEPPEPTPHARNREVLLRAPFSVPPLSFFHATLDIPEPEPARPLASGTWLARVRTSHARSDWKWTNRVGSRTTNFDGTYHEWVDLALRVGILDRVELGVRAAVAGWDEHQDRFNLFDDAGQPLVFGEGRKILGFGATARHENLSQVGLRAKGLLLDAERFGVDLSLAVSGRIPIARDRDLTHAGTWDVGFTLQASLPCAWGALHAGVGGLFPLGETTLFVEQARIDLNPLLHAYVGLTWAITDTVALGLQLQTNTSAFHEVDVLDQAPLTSLLGLRKTLWEHLTLEAGGGAGWRWSSSYQWSFFVSAAVEF